MEKDKQINDVDQCASSVRDDSGMNGSGTISKSDAWLTQPSSGDVPMSEPDFKAITRDLLAMRNRYGADSSEGHICSNIVQQLKNLKTWVRPEWATHEMQTLPYLIKQQMRALEEMTAGTR